METGKPFKQSYQAGVWNRYVFANITTRMALPFTWVFLRLGLSPTQVSLLSFAASLAGMAVLVVEPMPASTIAGALLLMVGHLWDHSDGQVARATGKGTLQGGLLDTILDRWVEAGWVLALGLAVALRPTAYTHLDWPHWMSLAVPAAAVFGILYFRWSMVQKDLFLLQKELRNLRTDADTPQYVRLDLSQQPRPPPSVTTFYVPFLFNRDVTIWMLFAATLIPDRLVGLAVVALAHVAKGLEKNWYTFGDLRKETLQVHALLQPDYHK